MFLLISVLNFQYISQVRILQNILQIRRLNWAYVNKTRGIIFRIFVKRDVTYEKEEKEKRIVHDEKLHLRKNINSGSQTPTDLYPSCLDSTPPQSV